MGNRTWSAVSAIEATNPSINFTITDNTIIGPGPATGVLTPYGILIQEGTFGEVKRNSISNMSYVGTTAYPKWVECVPKACR
jgi:hypothetical protein